MKFSIPQKIVRDFKEEKFFLENTKLLEPIYDLLFKNSIKKTLVVDAQIKYHIKTLLEYFKYLRLIIKKENLVITINNEKNKEILETFIDAIDKSYTEKAAKSLFKLVTFISNERTNINGIQILAWSLFKQASLDEIKDNFKNEASCFDILLRGDFLLMLLKSKNFIEIALQDVLIDLEFKDPTRRKGIFDKTLVRLLYENIVKTIPNFKYITKKDDKFFKLKTNWIIHENISRKINIPRPKRLKYIDLICKIGKSLILGNHKEQRVTGGNQGNQAKDAEGMFDFNKESLEKIKEIFNVKKIFLCIVIQARYTSIKSNHWDRIIDKVEKNNNKDKYLLNGYQLLNLIKQLG